MLFRKHQNQAKQSIKHGTIKFEKSKYEEAGWYEPLKSCE